MRTLIGISVLSSFALVLALVFTTTATAQLTPYSEDFEGLTQSDPAALGDADWLVSGLVSEVFDGIEIFKFFYGNFAAPNEQPGVAFSSIADGQGGAAQGTQYLNAFSDYNCCGLDLPGSEEGHGNGTDLVDSNLFREQTIGAGDVGKTMEFSFDAKLPGGDDAQFALAAPSLADAFIRTIGPDPFPVTAEVVLDLSTLLNDATWTRHTVSFDVTEEFVGNFFQFGFHNRSSNFNPTGVYYDNISLAPAGTADAAGDFDASGTVGNGDLTLLLDGWGGAPGSAWVNSVPSSVGNASLTELLDNWGNSYVSLSAVSVPEPGSLMLLALGTCLAISRRRALV